MPRRAPLDLVEPNKNDGHHGKTAASSREIDDVTAAVPPSLTIPRQRTPRATVYFSEAHCTTNLPARQGERVTLSRRPLAIAVADPLLPPGLRH